MKGVYAIEQQYGKGAHLYWVRVMGGVKGHRMGSPGEHEALHVGVILQGEQILRTVTAVVDDADKQRLDTAICKGDLALPLQGAILDSSSLLVASAPAATGVAGVR